MKIGQRVVELHRALDRHGIPHAFGGALALAYWTLDPRGTSDIDINVFTPVADCDRTLRALPDEVDQPDGTRDEILREGQIRLWWDTTPVDLFFDYARVHADAARDRQFVPFLDTEIPVLGPVELATFKAMFDRTKDWADIEGMIAAQRLDVEAVRESLVEMMGPENHRLARLADAERLAVAPSPHG
jgi:hypothetical protein